MLEDGKTFYSPASVELIFWKWLFYQKSIRDSRQSNQNSSGIQRTRENNPKFHIKAHKKNLQITKDIKQKKVLEVAEYLISNYSMEVLGFFFFLKYGIGQNQKK